MKKLIPFFIAIILIIIIAGCTFGAYIIEKFTYTSEVYDMNEYYQIIKDDDVAIMLQDEMIETKAKLVEGVCYMEFTQMQDLLNGRFYVDNNENLLIYTTPTDSIHHEIETDSYFYVNTGEQNTEAYQITRKYDGALYVALDYVKKFTNFSYEMYTEPNRMQMYTVWEEVKQAQIEKDTQVRYRGGLKSEILREMTAGETVVILEEMETWVKVKTDDAIIGYVEKKFLSDAVSVEMTPATDYEEPVYTSLTRDTKVGLGWHQVMVESANSSIRDVVANATGMNVISPTWFSLSDNEGNFTSIATQDYVDYAHEKGIEVWALIDNFNPDVSTFETLSYTSKRAHLIQQLVDKVLQYNIDGINVDFEEVSVDAGEHYIQFIRELSIACRTNGIILSVDNYVPTGGNEHYYREEQGIVADYFIIMGYDEHWGSGGVAGSVASIGFVESGIDKTVSMVPANKVINGVPFYTRVWKTSGGEVTSDALGMDGAAGFIEKYDVPVLWDEVTCQNYGEITMNDILYQVWLEDKQSLEVKLSVMDQYNLGGVAAWKLGFETPDVWEVMDAYINR